MIFFAKVDYFSYFCKNKKLNLMKTRFLLLFLVIVGIANAQSIEVGGTQTGVWEADTVLVVSDVKVADSLTVAPGTVVLFDGFYSIIVVEGASFKAQGTEDDGIRFTVADTTGFSMYNSYKGGWNGFRVQNAGEVRLDYCVVEYAKAADTTDMSGGAMRIENSDNVVANHSTFRCNRARESGGAVSAVNSHVVMNDCVVNDNGIYDDDNIYARYGAALHFLKCDVDLQVMEFLRNRGDGCIGGAISFDSCSVVLDRAVFVDNIALNGGGLYMMRSNHLPGRLSNLLFDHNYSWHFAGGLAFSDTSPEVYNILVTNNDSEGVNCTGIFFYQQSSPRLTNCIVYGNYPEPNEILQDTIEMWVWTYDDYAPEFRNCLIEGGTDHVTNAEYIKVFEDILEGDPLFVDAENHDFRLSEESPCRDVGNADVPDFLASGFDLNWIKRVSNDRIDIGPYEYSAASVPSNPVGSTDARLLGNPLSAMSRIEFGHEITGETVVSVYSMTGRKVGSKVFNLDRACVLEIGSLADRLASGVYLIEVAVPDRAFTLKAVR